MSRSERDSTWPEVLDRRERVARKTFREMVEEALTEEPVDYSCLSGDEDCPCRECESLRKALQCLTS